MIDGVIIKCLSGTYEVKTGVGVYKCKARGLFRLNRISPLTGDRVVIGAIDEKEREGCIMSVRKRKNELIRPRVANVDQTCIVFSSAKPDPDFLLMDKLIIAAYSLGLDAVICENKIDLADERTDSLAEYDMAGIETVRISAAKDINMAELAGYMKNKITVLAGQSGAGKSSIINRISGRMDQDTGDISVKNEKGRHTTRHAELIELKSGGYIIDTPGFSNFDITDMQYSELEQFYPEFIDFRGKCRFKGCSHISEPGCGVKEALAQGQIGSGRYARYVTFYNFLKEKDAAKYK